MGSDSPRIRVLVAEDHPVYLEGLAAAIEGADDLELVLACDDGARALEGIRSQAPDVAVLDLRLAVLDAHAVLEQLVDDGASCRVLILSAHLEGEEIIGCVE